MPLGSQHPEHVVGEQAAPPSPFAIASWPPSSPEPDDEELDVEVVASSPLPDEDPPYDELLVPPEDAVPLDAPPDPEPEPDEPVDDVPWVPTPASSDE